MMQSFLEHVLLKHDFKNCVAYLIRLQLVSFEERNTVCLYIQGMCLLQHLRKKKNFLEVTTLQMVQKHLNIMDDEVKRRK